MSVDLPPPQAPLAVSAAQIPQNDSPYTTRFLARPLIVHGAPLTPQEIESALADATDLDIGLRQLTLACQNQGYPAARLLYAPGRDSVQVLFVPGGVARVMAVKPLDRYFEPLVGKQPLRDSDFEPARVLAGIHAQRAGISSVPHFRGDILEANADTPAKGYELSLQFDNSGDRFAGRHFLELSGKLGLPSGDEFEAGMREGLPGLNSEAAASSYHAPSLGWSRVMPAGMISAKASYARYDYTATLFEPPFFVAADTELTGTSARAQVSWLQMLRADLKRRWTAEIQVDYTMREVERRDDGRSLRDEKYPSLQLTSTYAPSFAPWGRKLTAESTLVLRKGFGGNEDTAGASRQDYLLAQPSLGFDLAWNDAWTTSLKTTAQISGEVLPEQEQFFLGGSDNASAWLPGIAVGDEGYYARLDTSWTHAWGASTLTPRVFVEHGGARLRDARPGFASQKLTDAGMELAFEWSTWLEGSLAYAVPLADQGIDHGFLDRNEARLYFTIMAKL